MNDVIFAVLLSAIISITVTILVMDTHLRIDCETLGKFRLNDNVYTCIPQENEDET